jgi:nucleotide-binding universal stress UspA family protein
MNLPRQSTHPIPVDTTRDADGRLVGLTIDHGLDVSATNSNAWLVAVDGSEYSLYAVAEAIRLATKMKDCTLHVVNVQHWLSKEAAELELMNQGLAATDATRALLDEAGVPWRLHIVMGEAADSIKALADKLGCHGIVIGSRGLGAAVNLLIGSVAYKVIHMSRIAVLVVR